VNIQTSEGYAVQLDLTSSTGSRTRSSHADHRTRRLFEDSAVIRAPSRTAARARRAGRGDFYRGDKRVQKSRAAQQALEAELRDKGIRVVQVLIRRYTYDQRYQQAIEQRKIQDQTVYKNEAEAKSASAAAAKNRSSPRARPRCRSSSRAAKPR